MNTGKILMYFFSCVSVLIKVVQTAMCAKGNSCLGARSTCLRSGCCAQRHTPVLNTFFGVRCNTLPLWIRYTFKMTSFQFGHVIVLFLFIFFRVLEPKCQDFKRNVKRAAVANIKTLKKSSAEILYLSKSSGRRAKSVFCDFNFPKLRRVWGNVLWTAVREKGCFTQSPLKSQSAPDWNCRLWENVCNYCGQTTNATDLII